MRIVIVSNVFGRFGYLQQLISSEKPDLVIATGTFGFLSSNSAETLETTSLIQYCSYLKLAQDKSPSVDMQRAKLSAHLSDPKNTVEGVSFSIPVVAMWGEGDDVFSVDAFRRAGRRSKNLWLVDELSYARVGNVAVFACPGSLSLQTLFIPYQGSIPTPAEGKFRTTILQVSDFVRTLATEDADNEKDKDFEVRIFLSNASPTKEKLAARLAYEARADLVVFPSQWPCCLNEACAVSNIDVLDDFIASMDVSRIGMEIGNCKWLNDSERESARAASVALSRDLAKERSRLISSSRSCYRLGLSDCEMSHVKLEFHARGPSCGFELVHHGLKLGGIPRSPAGPVSVPAAGAAAAAAKKGDRGRQRKEKEKDNEKDRRLCKFGDACPQINNCKFYHPPK